MSLERFQDAFHGYPFGIKGDGGHEQGTVHVIPDMVRRNAFDVPEGIPYPLQRVASSGRNVLQNEIHGGPGPGSMNHGDPCLQAKDQDDGEYPFFAV